MGGVIPDQSVTDQEPLGDVRSTGRGPRQSIVNIMTLTFVHDILGDAISVTGSFPLVCDPSDGRLTVLRQFLVDEFDRVTAPLSEKQPVSPMWGEWTEKPGEDLQKEGIYESAPKLVVVTG